MEEMRSLSLEHLREPLKVKERATQKLLDKERRPNIIGLGVGGKIKAGQLTEEPALVVLVTQKVANEALSKDEKIPELVEDVKTDVIEVGFPQALVNLLAPTGKQTNQQDALLTFVDGARQSTTTSPAFPTETGRMPVEIPMQVQLQQLAKRIRPAPGGWSVGHYQITAGTIATCVYDFLPGANTSPSSYGVGMPAGYYILSNNHVLANSNDARLGDPILQPGPYDGGTHPADKIASLSRFVPIQFAPQVPLTLQNNLVDAAIAQGSFEDLDRSIYWTGDVRGWYRKNDVQVGMFVKKTGRTTKFTIGRIQAINATIDVGYGGNRVARFRDQIITTNMSAGGDSGSLVLQVDDNKAVGLLFAGSSSVSIINQFENVRALLRIELWP